MTKKEALEFLELPESATDVEIKIRMADKLSYFEELSEKAPSDFLRRLHGKNVAKIKKIQEESAEWISPESRSEVILPFEPDTDEKLADENDLPATTIIISSGSKASRQKQTAVQPLAWLVRHMEDKGNSSFPIFFGKNFIGRKINPELSPFILIDDDAFVSRVHAVLFVQQGDPNEFFIVDSKSSNNGSASKNGTYINGKKERITIKVKLQENDTIQVGVTKLVFKLNTKELSEILEDVQKSNYTNTVVLDEGK